jgi:thiosulfate dehydrogenase [quinone] large subunit
MTFSRYRCNFFCQTAKCFLATLADCYASFTFIFMKNASLILIRLALGTSLFVHGLVRLPAISKFVSKMQSDFAETMLPKFLVTPMAWLIPISELVFGTLFLMGLLTRIAAIGNGILMIVLVAGSCFLENWDALPSQFLHLALGVVIIEFFDKRQRGSLDYAFAKA